MKQTLIAASILLALLACKKNNDSVEIKKETYTFRIEGKAPSGTVYYSNVAYYSNAIAGSDNEFGTLSFAGHSGGYYVLDLTNKQACGIDFSIQWMDKDTTIYVSASSTKRIQLPGMAQGGLHIRAKPLYTCASSGGDMEWVELEVPQSLPIKFKYMRTEEIKGEKNRRKVIFEVEESEPGSVFTIQVSVGTADFKNVATIKLDESNPNRQYSEIINL